MDVKYSANMLYARAIEKWKEDYDVDRFVGQLRISTAV